MYAFLGYHRLNTCVILLFIFLSLGIIKNVDAKDVVRCDKFLKEPEKKFLEVFFSHSEGEIDVTWISRAFGRGLSCKPSPKSIGSNKNQIGELTFPKINNSREYYIKAIINPRSGASMTVELKKQVDLLDNMGKKYDTNARWVIILSEKGSVLSGDLCSHLIELAKGPKSICKGHSWNGDNALADGKLVFDKSKKPLHATYWMKSHEKYYVALVCIEKAKGACTRESVKVATSGRTKCADGPPLNDIDLFAEITTYSGLPSGGGSKTMPKGTNTLEPVELNSYYSISESGGNEIQFQKNSDAKCLKFLEWSYGYMTTTEILDGIPVLSGEFSGCPYIKYRYKKKLYITHIGTCKKGMEDSKKAWNSFYDKNKGRLEHIRCFDPADDKEIYKILPNIRGGHIYAIADNSLTNLDTIYIMSVGNKGMPQQGTWNKNDPITAMKSGKKFKKFDESPDSRGCN